MEIVDLKLHYPNLNIKAFLDTLDQEIQPKSAPTIEAMEGLAVLGGFLWSMITSFA